MSRTDSICTFFASGKCKFGSNCRFLHDSYTSIDPLTLENIDDKHVSVKDLQSLSGAASVHPQGLQSTQKDQKVCYFFKQNGRCNFGSKCKFSHQVNKNGISRKSKDKESSSKRGALHDHGGYVSFDLPQQTKEVKDQQVSQHRYEQAASDDFGNWCTRRQQDLARSGEAGHSTLNHIQKEYGKSSKNGPLPDGKNNRGQKSRRLCKFYKAGFCSMGSACRFWHPQDLVKPLTVLEDTAGQHSTGAPGHGQRKFVGRPIVVKPTELKLDILTDESCIKWKQAEIDFLTRRFSTAKELEEGTSWLFPFVSSDPDWPYDVNELLLVVNFPAGYPRLILEVKVFEDQELPSTVKSHVTSKLDTWIKERYVEKQKAGTAELVLRPLLKWLDKSLEELFTEGLKQYKRQLEAEAAGVQFLSASDLQEEFSTKCAVGKGEHQADGSADSRSDDEDDDAEGGPGSEDLEGGDSSSDSEGEPPEVSGDGSNLEAARRGTEVKLMSLQLKEQAASLLMTHASLLLQCERCKGRTELKTPAHLANCVECVKCHEDQLVRFRPSLAHPLSSIVGYLDLKGCSAFDLVLMDCDLMVGCLNCSKDMKIQGLSAGVPKDVFCRCCNKKMRIATDSVRFQQLTPTEELDESDSRRVQVQKVRKVAKDPAIQLGQPLPDDGTCKHYRKSFRWLRFPCCGKAYPCDCCHDDNETDHDMKYATRMICGFCCREQPYAVDRPCVACGSSLTKRSSTHWEGGRGCRDKIKMARGDEKKYANINKTVSRASQAKEDGKRSTKLRHVAK